MFSSFRTVFVQKVAICSERQTILPENIVQTPLAKSEEPENRQE